MIKQYLKQAIRLISENKLLSVISILGTALAICMIMVIVILYVVNTASFKPEVNRSRTYYFTTVKALGKEDGRRVSYSQAALPLVRACYYPLECAEVVTAVYRDDYTKMTATGMDGINSYSCTPLFTDTAFWKLFEFDFIDGGPFSKADFESGLKEVVISESLARSIFGSEKVVGQEFKLEFVPFRICGVVKDVSRFANKAYADIWAPYTFQAGYDRGGNEGISGSFSCYALLKEGYTQEDMRKEVLNRLATFNSTLTNFKADINYQPRSQMEEWIGGGYESETNMKTHYLRYGSILFILLLVPALNLSGITLTRMKKRIAELGVRRAFGATRGQIIGQVLLENMALTLLGGVIGLAFSYVAMLLLRDWLLVSTLGEAGMSLGMFNGYVFLAAFFFCLVMNLMSAGLPAYRVSSKNITDSINS